jgi:phenazine biosynthesis protein phzE
MKKKKSSTKNLFSENRPFALVRKGDTDIVSYFSGQVKYKSKLSDIPRYSKNGYHTLNIIPYSQIKERGYKVRDDNCKIISLIIEDSEQLTLEQICESIDTEQILLKGDIHYTTTDDEYKNIVQKIISEEIGNGEGANFVIPRKGQAQIADFSFEKALSIFKSVLEKEIGAYFTYLVYDGNSFFIGASPEKHISVKDGRVKMNPISGTFRKKQDYKSIENFKQDFIKFLRDEKEINELFMVVDEELKMMAQICSAGGMIIGPLLKEMSKLIHTEYILAGNSDRDVIDILRESMFAATVMGGPLENAANIIYKYEPEGRRYYGGAIALVGKDESGEFLDSPIMIRSIEIDKKGHMQFQVGATLVRDSSAKSELEETNKKISGVLDSFLSNNISNKHRYLDNLQNDEDIPELLQWRNQQLSNFWFFNQTDSKTSVLGLENKKIVIMDNEDDFCYMQKHMLGRMGLTVDVIRYNNFTVDSYKDYDLIIVGPGTGNPNDSKSPKIEKVFNITKSLLEDKKPFLSICLGHQVLCRVLGIEVKRKKKTFQGVPKEINLFGRSEIVGFYNTFAGFFSSKDNFSDKINLSYDKTTGEIFALKGKEGNFTGLQFHPESILTQNGYNIFKEVLLSMF